MREKWTDENQMEMTMLVKQGYTVAEICEIMDKPIGTVGPKRAKLNRNDVNPYGLDTRDVEIVYTCDNIDRKLSELIDLKIGQVYEIHKVEFDDLSIMEFTGELLKIYPKYLLFSDGCRIETYMKVDFLCNHYTIEEVN